MAEQTIPAASTVSTADRRQTVQRQLTGTSFLTLEHVGYFALVVLLPSLLLLGTSTALSLWRQGGSQATPDVTSFMSYTVDPIMHFVDTSVAIGLVAAFLVLVPLMYGLRRRTAAEYAKRPGYTNRVGYKLPIYTALALLAAQALGALTSMVGIFLNSLVNIGVKGADIGGMYLSQFLPAFMALVIFGVAAWYVACFAKGKDASKSFVSSVVLFAGVLVIALFVTTLTLNHDAKTSEPLRQDLPYQLDQDYRY